MVMELQHRVFTGNHAIEATAVGTTVNICKVSPLSNMLCNKEDVDMVLAKANIPLENFHFYGFIGVLVIDTGTRIGFDMKFAARCDDILVADHGRLHMFDNLEKLKEEYDILSMKGG